MEAESVSSMKIVKEETIAAPVEIVFQAVLDELGPECQLQPGKPFPMKLEAWPGGRWYRDTGNNTGHFWGTVQVIKPPALVEIVGPMPMSYPAVNHIQYRLTGADGGKTVLKFVHRAMGLIEKDHRDGMGQGWGYAFDRIRELAETRVKRK
jgi:uncharacterized protein YndB with AHSA1/START domain